MIDFPRRHEWLVAIDSDGCVFDTMELKHKECFIPCFINAYGLQAVSKFARETWEFVNLYSKSRGVNRFPALVETLERLRSRADVIARGVKIEVPESLAKWCREETRLTNSVLEAKAKASGDRHLAHALAWSHDVNKAIASMVRDVPPFPFVRESLAKLSQHADLIVCSATPTEALKAEWHEHKIDQHVAAIFGQEVGNKKEILAAARVATAGQTLMVGDAPGDHKAADANGCLFQPINPGAEDGSWKSFFETGITRFFERRFAGEFQTQLLSDFQRLLPTHPTWKTVS